jgi:hypothetical protein
MLISWKDFSATIVPEKYHNLLSSLTQWTNIHKNNHSTKRKTLQKATSKQLKLEAREKTIGLWSAPAVPPWEYRIKK